MNIGIFGNTNNYPYLLALGLRRLGANVRLVVNRPDPLHRPEAKDPALRGNYPDWILDASALDEDDFIVESPRIANALNFTAEGMDAVILNDLGPALYRLIERPAIALLTGSDLTYYADFASAAIRRANWDPDFARSRGGRLAERRWLEFVARQRDGILAARSVSFALPGLISEGDRLLDQLGVPTERRVFLYMGDTTLRRPQRRFQHQRLRILNGARLNWCHPFPIGFSSQDDKASDVLVRGFAQFVAAGGNAELRMVAKGLHVAQTRSLVRELNLDERVVWLKEMPLADFYDEIALADVVCDQLGPSFPGQTALDAMAMGKPVIANFRLEILGQHIPEAWPVRNACSVEQVCAALLELQTSPDVRVELGQRAEAFAQRHLSPEVNARRCLERLGFDVKTEEDDGRPTVGESSDEQINSEESCAE